MEITINKEAFMSIISEKLDKGDFYEYLNGLSEDCSYKMTFFHTLIVEDLKHQNETFSIMINLKNNVITFSIRLFVDKLHWSLDKYYKNELNKLSVFMHSKKFYIAYNSYNQKKKYSTAELEVKLSDFNKEAFFEILQSWVLFNKKFEGISRQSEEVINDSNHDNINFVETLNIEEKKEDDLFSKYPSALEMSKKAEEIEKKMGAKEISKLKKEREETLDAIVKKVRYAAGSGLYSVHIDNHGFDGRSLSPSGAMNTLQRLVVEDLRGLGYNVEYKRQYGRIFLEVSWEKVLWVLKKWEKWADLINDWK